MVRIYTRGGDKGQTSLADGSRVAKSGPRVDLYGEVDELNSVLGLAAAGLSWIRESAPEADPLLDDLDSHVAGIQNRLFDLSGVLADPRLAADLAARSETEQPFAPGDLERAIDAMEESLPPLQQFILPGGDETAARLHVARSVCRRVERKAVALAAVEAVPAGAIAYLNRLSDFLFDAARLVNHRLGAPETPWRPGAEFSPADDEGARE